MHLLTTLGAAAAITSMVLAQDTRWCGNRAYSLSQYLCYPDNGNALCPIKGGTIYKPCGSGENARCFDIDHYGCDNGRVYPTASCGHVQYDTTLYVCSEGNICPLSAPVSKGSGCYPH